MGWVQKSKKDLHRIEVLTEVLAGRRTTDSATGVLSVSLRQTQRLLARYEDGGGATLIHSDFGPTLAMQALCHSMERVMRLAPRTLES